MVSLESPVVPSRIFSHPIIPADRCRGIPFTPSFSCRCLQNGLSSFSSSPSPSGQPGGPTPVSTGGSCLSSASWAALQEPTSARSNVTDLGEHGFESFSRKKSTSAAVPKPGFYQSFYSFPQVFGGSPSNALAFFKVEEIF
jgi:hypothetical protein